MSGKDRLTILTICKEPVLNILRFVAWHRDLGADRIVIHFDDPEDPAIPHVGGLDFVETVRCTPEFWRGIGIAPDKPFVKRQNAAITSAYRRVRSGWVGVLDGDELFCDETGDLPGRLAGLPPEVRALRVGTAEAISVPGRPGPAHFRLMLPPPAVRAIYGALAPLVRRNGGLAGHTEGKSIARAGLEIGLFRQHWPVGPDGGPISDPAPAEGLRLLHFLAADSESWRRKLEWRLANWGLAPGLKAHLLERAASGGDPAAVWHEVWRGLHEFDAVRLERLAAAGGLFVPGRDLLAPARRLFGAALIDRLARAQDPGPQD